DHGGKIRHIAITLETTAGPPVTKPVTSTHCTIALPASRFATTHGSSLASMLFSSDGSTLAWGEDNGVYGASVSDPGNCARAAGPGAPHVASRRCAPSGGVLCPPGR